MEVDDEEADEEQHEEEEPWDEDEEQHEEAEEPWDEDEEQEEDHLWYEEEDTVQYPISHGAVAAAAQTRRDDEAGEPGNERTKLCTVCTLLNYPSASRCTLCRTAFGAQAGTGSSSSSRETRACPSCTSWNDSDATQCSICLSSFDLQQITEDAQPQQELQQEQLLKGNEGISEKPCSSCTLLNDLDAKVCKLCNTSFEQPAAAAAASSSHERPHSFNCPACNQEFSSTDSYPLQYCKHLFCRPCIVNWVGESLSRLPLLEEEEEEKSKMLTEEVTWIRCPVQGCTQLLSRQDIRGIAGMAVLNHLDKWALRIMAYKQRQGTEDQHRSKRLKLPHEKIIWDDERLESICSTVRSLEVVYKQCMDSQVQTSGKEKIPKRARKKSKQLIDDTMVEVLTARKPKMQKSKQLMDDTMVEVLKKLSGDLRSFSEAGLPYLVTVLLCSDPTVHDSLCWLLRNDSTLDIAERANLYFQVFSLMRTMSANPELLPLLCVSDSGHDCWNNCSEQRAEQGSLMNLFEKLHKQASFILVNQMQFNDDESSAVEAALVAEAKYVFEELEERIRWWKSTFEPFAWFKDADEFFKEKWPGIFNGSTSISKPPTDEKEERKEAEEYLAGLKALQFSQASLVESHYFRDKINWVLNNPSRARRISKEIAGLATNLPLEYHSSIHVRVDEHRMDLLRALIIGPDDTPYQNGIFLFDMFMGENYPNSPPEVKFLTTASGTVRFNPNLYNDGKVCLSLLGTWSGPSWLPGTSTILQVLVSLQSLVFVSDPFYNEPGCRAGTHKAESEYYNWVQRHNTLSHSILPALRDPDPAFRELIEAHLRLKRRAIEAQCDDWAKSSVPTSGSRRASRWLHGSAQVSANGIIEAARQVKKELVVRFPS